MIRQERDLVQTPPMKLFVVNDSYFNHAYRKPRWHKRPILTMPFVVDVADSDIGGANISPLSACLFCPTQEVVRFTWMPSNSSASLISPKMDDGT